MKTLMVARCFKLIPWSLSNTNRQGRLLMLVTGWITGSNHTQAQVRSLRPRTATGSLSMSKCSLRHIICSIQHGIFD